MVVEGPGPAADDDWTLELKESREREAATVVRLQRQMQERPDLDPHLGWTKLEGKGMRVRRLSPQHRRLSVERLVDAIKSPHWGKKDLRAWPATPAACSPVPTAAPPPPRASPAPGAIARAAGDGRGLTYETVQLTERAAETLEQDRQHCGR